HVELAVAHVGVGHPAAYVVVDGELRVPVAEVEHLAVLAHSGGTGLGNLEAPGELELAPPAGGNGVCEPDLHHGVGDGVARPTSLLDEWLAARANLGKPHARGQFLASVADHAGCVEVLTKVDVNALERVRRVVDVGGPRVTVQRGRRRGERRFDLVGGRVRPVVGSRRAGLRARTGFDGAVKARIGDDGVGAGALRLRKSGLRGPWMRL